jgi:hypothetical protein
MSSLTLSIFFTVQYYQSLRQTEFYDRATTSSQRLEKELADANAQVIRSMRNVEAASAQLVEQRRRSEKELSELQHRYEAFRALAMGQEKIAAAHRAILEYRPFGERLWEQTTAFLIGVLSSLVAAIIVYVLKARPVSRSEADELSRNDRR